MNKYPSSFAQMKSIDQFPEYPSSHPATPSVTLKPTYPIAHRTRRKAGN